MRTPPPIDPGQAAIEERHRRLSLQSVDPRTPATGVYGTFEDWIFELGDSKLFLNPVSDRWLVLHPLYEDWEDTNRRAGDGVFAIEGAELVFHGHAPTTEAAARVRVDVPGLPPRIVPLGVVTRIGSGPDDDCVIPSVGVPGTAALVVRRDGSYVAVAEDARVPLIVQGAPAGDTHVLRSGDVLTLGPARLEFTLPPLPAAAAVNPAAVSPAAARTACPACGAPAPSDRGFCTGCGASLAPPIPVPARDVVAPGQHRFCRKCGAPLAGSARFCTTCGQPAAPSPPTPPACSRCRAPLAPAALFCNHCGQPRPRT